MPARMAAGKMRHLLELQRNEGGAPDSRGQPTENWQTQERAHAAIEPLTGNEQPLNSQIHATVSHRITFRWMASVSPSSKWRLLYGTRVFHIESIVNIDERNEYFEAMCTEVPS